MPAVTLVLAPLILAGCVAAPEAPPPAAPQPVPVAGLAARLPQDAAGLRRGQTLPLGRGEAGREVAYASRGRTGAGATVELHGAGGLVPEGPDSPAAVAGFEDLLQDALRAQPHRRVREQSRFTLPEAGPAALRCAETEGSYGRVEVQGLLCAGGFGGRLVRLRLTVPEREAAGTNPRAFAGAIAAALRGAPAGR